MYLDITSKSHKINLNNCFEIQFQVDLISMDSRDDGYKYIMTFIDHFSKFVVLKPLSKQGQEVVRNLRDSVFSIFGKPSILQTDNGGEFIDRHMDELSQNWPGQCQFIHGRPRHPQSQGIMIFNYFVIIKLKLIS